MQTPARRHRTSACLHAPGFEVQSEHQPDSRRLLLLQVAPQRAAGDVGEAGEEGDAAAGFHNHTHAHAEACTLATT